MSEAMIFWMILLIVAIVTEAITLGLTSIWFAGRCAGSNFCGSAAWTFVAADCIVFSGIPVTAVFHKTGCGKVF